MDVTTQRMSSGTEAKSALIANKEHQAAMKAYIEQLEGELDSLDQLLESAQLADNIEDEDPDVDVGGYIVVPGSQRVTGLLSTEQMLDKSSPFHADAVIRQQYLNYTEHRAMTKQTIDALSDAVRSENYRMHAYEAQRRGEQAFVSLAKYPQEFFEQNKQGIDWERVADRVSTSSHGALVRTAQECEIRWIGNQHPSLDHGPWTLEETNRLKKLVMDTSNGGNEETDWVKISAELGGHRTPIDCMKHAMSHNRKQPAWSGYLDEKLQQAVALYGSDNWYLVAKKVADNVTPIQCGNRWNRLNMRRDEWSFEEDDRLRAAYDIYGPSWADVAVLIPGRTNEQCSDRWDQLQHENSHTIPTSGRNSKSGKRWTEEEDNALRQVVEELGAYDWSAVASRLGNKRSAIIYRRRYQAMKKEKKQTPPISAAENDESDDNTFFVTEANHAKDTNFKKTKTLSLHKKRPRSMTTTLRNTSSAVPALQSAASGEELGDEARDRQEVQGDIDVPSLMEPIDQIESDVEDTSSTRHTKSLPLRTHGRSNGSTRNSERASSVVARLPSSIIHTSAAGDASDSTRPRPKPRPRGRRTTAVHEDAHS